MPSTSSRAIKRSRTLYMLAKNLALSPALTKVDIRQALDLLRRRWGPWEDCIYTCLYIFRTFTCGPSGEHSFPLKQHIGGPSVRGDSNGNYGRKMPPCVPIPLSISSSSDSSSS